MQTPETCGFEPRSVKPSVLEGILAVIRENSRPLKDAELRKQATVENLMLRQYLRTPEISYTRCALAIQPLAQEYALTGALVRERAEALGMTESTDRAKLVDWAKNTAYAVYLSMTNGSAALQEIETWLERSPGQGKARKQKLLQERLLLFGLFEWIPQLRDAEESSLLTQFGEKYSARCIKNIISAVVFDTATQEQQQLLEKGTDVETLRRKLFLARKELADYKELVDAADLEVETRAEAMKLRELTAFFAQLNDKQYGYLIDSMFSVLRACQSLEQKRIPLPYEVENIPVVLRRFITFLRNAGVSPATPYPPHSVQRLTPVQMEGSQFEADVTRLDSLDSETALPVYVVSSGWKYRGQIIAAPVFRELRREEETK